MKNPNASLSPYFRDSFFFFPVVFLLLLFQNGWGQTTLYSTNYGSPTCSWPTGWSPVGGATQWGINTTSASSGYAGASGECNAANGTSGTSTLVFDNSLSTVGYTSITVLWGARMTASGASPTFQWSPDGSTWNSVAFTDVANNSTWGLVNGGTRISLPVGAEGESNLRFKFISNSGAATYRIDDFSVEGTASGNSTSSDIITANNETANIDYASKTAASITATTDAIRVWSFTIRDGGGAADGDAVVTILTSVTVDKGASNGVTSWANTVKQAALYDGVTEVAEISVTGETMAFSSISVTAADDGNKTLDLYLTFETTNITDNQQFQFRIQKANTTTDGAGSSFAAFADVTSSVTGDNNRIEVTATKLNFVQQPSNTLVSTAMSPAVTVEAADANNNRDLDFADNIRITSTGTLSGSPVDVAAASGLASFGTLTHTATGSGLTLNAERTATLDWDVTSSTFDITSIGPILTFDFSGLAGSEPSANSNFNDARLDVSSIVRGENISANADADRFNSSAWTSGAAPDLNDFVEFSVSPLECKKFSIASIVMQHQRSATGPVEFVLRSDQDNFTANLDGAKNIGDVTTTQTTTFTFTMSDIATDVAFRIYGYLAEAGTGSWGPGDGAGDDITVNGNTADNTCTPKYYRSAATGNWNSAATWEDSDDNGVGDPWAAAATFPTSTDYSITIRSPHVVTINHTPSTINETTIDAGGTLTRTGTGAAGDYFAISNGTGDDLVIYGTYRHNDANDGKHTGSGTVRIKSSGVLEALNNNDGTIDYYGNNQNTAFAATIIWEDASVFKWSTVTVFSSSGYTYFPNAAASVIPVFRINATLTTDPGGQSPTVINGYFEVASGFSLTWTEDKTDQTGTKTFRNGLGGDGNIVMFPHASADQRCGGFIISGTATIGGSGSITINQNDLTIASASVVTILSNKVIDQNNAAGTIVVNGILDAQTYTLSGTAEFTLSSGGTLITANTSGVNGSVNVTGTETFNVAANYTFDGFAAQVTGTDMSSTVNNLTISNTSATGVTLTQNTALNGTLTLTDGVLFTTTAELLTINDGGTASSGNSGSFVDGPLKKTGNETFDFPVGDGTKWARIGITAPTTATTQYTAQYFAVNPTTAGFTSTSLAAGPPTLNNVSEIEYWKLDQAINNDDVQVTLYWESATSSGIDDCDGTPDDLRVAHWNTTNVNWEINVDAVVLTGTCGTSGTIKTNSNQPDYSPFAFGSKSSGRNPLPVEWLDFTGTNNGKYVELNWQTAAEINNSYFEIQKNDGMTEGWKNIGKVPGAGNSSVINNYAFIDNALSDGALFYYRLKQTDYDGKYDYSKIISIEIEPHKFSVDKFYMNNEKKSIAFILNDESFGDVTAKIIDVSGRTIARQNISKNKKLISFSCENISEGIYFLMVESSDKVLVRKFGLY